MGWGLVVVGVGFGGFGGFVGGMFCCVGFCVVLCWFGRFVCWCVSPFR